MFRQGDLLFVPIPKKSVPKKITIMKHGVLAEGEATGHKHEITPVDLSKCDVFSDEDGTIYIKVRETLDIIHPEHGTITLKPTKGVYEVRRQREYVANARPRMVYD